MDYEEKVKDLYQLECHFKWKPEGDSMVCNITTMEPKLLQNIKENALIEVQAYTLLSYLFAKGNIHGNDVDYTKAEDYAKNALEKSSSNGERFVILSNKLHMLHEKRKKRDFETLFYEVQSIRNNLDDKDKCKIKLQEAFALTRFGLREYAVALDRYREAIQLDCNVADGHFGVGLVLGRIRRFYNGHSSMPDEEEIKAFKQAVVLWEYKNPFALVWYAYVLISCIKPHGRDKNISIELEKYSEIDSLFNIALESSTHSSIIYKWCAKGYKRLCLKGALPRHLYNKYIEKQKMCVDAACETSPCDSSSLHEKGLFYWRVNKYKDLSKAKDLLKKSCTYCPLSNFPADIDYVIIRKQTENNFNALDAYVALLKKYEHRDKSSPFEHLDLAILHMRIGLELLSTEDDEEGAKEEFHEALRYDPKCVKVRNAKTKLFDIINREISYNVTNLQKKVKLMLELGQVQNLVGNKSESLAVLEQIIELDELNIDARTELSVMFFKEKRYQECVEMCKSVARLTGEIDPHVHAVLAKSTYLLAQQADSSLNEPETYTLFMDSAELGLIESCFKILSVLQERSANNILYQCTKDVYETCSQLLSPSHYISLDEEKQDLSDYITSQKKILHEEVTSFIIKFDNSDVAVESFKDLCELRQKRFDITQQKEKVDTIQVLSEARNQLDRLFKRFVDKNYPESANSRKKYYYPYLAKADYVESEHNHRLRMSQERIEILLEHPKKGMALSGFTNRFPELFQFLSEHQATFDCKFNFLPEFCELVNNHKHDTNQSEGDLYELAHLACEYVEEVVVNLNKYL